MPPAARKNAVETLRAPSERPITVENLLIIFVPYFFPFSNKLAYICTHERNVAKYRTKRLSHPPCDVGPTHGSARAESNAASEQRDTTSVAS